MITASCKHFFRNRIIFPIHSLSAKVITFAWRICDSLSSRKELDLPKYFNSPESNISHKSHTLYDIHLAKRAIRQKDGCILVEGYTDLIALHQAGTTSAASFGTVRKGNRTPRSASWRTSPPP